MPRLPIILAPYSDELLSSWVQRLASIHNLRVQELLKWLGGIPAGDELDLDVDPPQEFIERLARATGYRETRLARHCAIRKETVVERTNRIVFCPTCWDDDIHAGGAPYMRREWIDAWCFRCRPHRMILQTVRENVSLSDRPFIGSVWAKDIHWARAANVPYDRKLIGYSVAPTERLNDGLRRTLLDQTWFSFPCDMANCEAIFERWFRHCWNLWCEGSEVFDGIPTPLTVVTDLTHFSAIRFGHQDSFQRWLGITNTFSQQFSGEWPIEKRFSPCGTAKQRAASVVAGRILWQAMLGDRIADNDHAQLFVSNLLPLTRSENEVRWMAQRTARWPADRQTDWEDLLSGRRGRAIKCRQANESRRKTMEKLLSQGQ